MKSITVKGKDLVKTYLSGFGWDYDENGKSKEIVYTDDEAEQRCYQSLIRDVKRQEFNKVMIKLILGYLEYEDEQVENIKIKITNSKGLKCEINIPVIDNWV